MLLSAIIPTHNRAGRLADLLDSLGSQDHVQFEWEVVVVDNASTDDTADVVHSKTSALPIAIRYAYEPNPGLHNGRHRGAMEARGECVGFLDDDMLLAPTWIQGVRPVYEGQADAVVGRILPKWEAQPPEWLSTFWTDNEIGTLMPYLGLLDLGDSIKEVPPRYVFGGNCFMRKQLLWDLGGFHPDGMPNHLLRLRGDGETGLMRKFEARGLRSWYDPRATAFHIIDASRLTIEYICRRAYNQGISDSYTSFRSGDGLIASSRSNRPAETLFNRISQKTPSEIAAALGRRVSKVFSREKKEPESQIKRQIDQAYREGRSFHQNEVSKDPSLLEYIRKNNYLDECGHV